MEWTWKYYCRCCYHAGELKMLSGQTLDVYTLICHPQGLKDDAAEILACFRCHEFLKEVHCFRNEHRGDELENLDVIPPQVDLILSCAINENSAKMGIKTEIVGEDVEMDQIDIHISKVEVDSDPETSYQISETSRESLLVSMVEKSEMEVHNSLNLNDKSLLSELRAIPNIGTSKSMSKPLKRLGKVYQKNHDRPFKCNECLYETSILGNLKKHITVKHSDGKPFFCDQCDYHGKSKSYLTSHMKIHSRNRERPFKCNECSYEATTSSLLKRHFSYKHSDKRPFSCEQCDSRFKRKTNLSEHMKIHLMKPERPFRCNERPFKCNECSYATATARNLKHHIRSRHCEERPFYCDHCDYNCKMKYSIRAHMKKHFPKRKSFKCNKCSYKGMTSHYLKSHILHKHSDERPYFCDQCDSSFKTSSDLGQHKKTHLTKRDKPFKCNECSFETAKLFCLNQHIVYKHSDERQFPCDQCDFRFKTKTNLSKHLKIHIKNPDRPFKCNKRSHATTTVENLKYHIKNEHYEEYPYSCEHCDYKCKMKYYLQSHMKKHFPKWSRLLKCNECSYEAKTSSLLKRHFSYKHCDERPFSCDQCEARFKRKSNLSEHMKIHLMEHERPFKCNECSYTGITIRYLENHIRINHSEERPFSCDHCDFNCKMKYSLRTHMKNHFPKLKLFKCNECSYKGMTLYYLKRHILRKHNDNRPYFCDQCDARFKTNSDLGQHKKIHLTERDKPFKCNECSFESVKLFRLNRHIVFKHNDERQFSCDQCDSRFKTKSNLSAHSQIHMKNREKPYKCTECSHECATSSKLKNHMRNKHCDEKLFSCDRCEYRCKNNSDLSKHLKIHLK